MEVHFGQYDSRGFQGRERREYGSRHVYGLVRKEIGGPYSECGGKGSYEGLC